MFWYNLL